MDLFWTKDSLVLPIIERIRRIDEQFLKIKYIWLNHQIKIEQKVSINTYFKLSKTIIFGRFGRFMSE
jgi:hypothetical protein